MFIKLLGLDSRRLFKVGAFSRTLVLQGDCSKSCLVKVFWSYATHSYMRKTWYFLHDSLLDF